MSVVVEPLFLVSATVVLVAVLLPVLLAPRKNFAYAVLYDGMFEVSDESEADGKDVPDDEEAARERVRVVAVEMKNSSGRHIERPHYARPITVGFGEGARILGAEVIEEDPPGIGATLRGVPEREPERVALAPVLLNDGDTVLLEVVVSNAAYGVVEVDGRIVGIRRVVDRSRSNLEKVLLVANAGVLFVAAILAGNADVLMTAFRVIDVGPLDPSVVSIAGGVLAGTVVSTMLLLSAMVRRRWRASRIERLVRSRYLAAGANR